MVRSIIINRWELMALMQAKKAKQEEPKEEEQQLVQNPYPELKEDKPMYVAVYLK